MRVTLGVGVTRAGVDELITGLWSFANVLGLLTNVIGERTLNAGVTVDGLLIRDSNIPQAAVTAHEAALAILESQIADGTILARLASAELITGLWSFANAAGLLADVIGERSSGLGVTIDSVRLRDGVVRRIGATLATDPILEGLVSGDAEARFSQQVDGRLDWGSGSAARDTNLFRNAANELKTDDALTVALALTTQHDFIVPVLRELLAAQGNNIDMTGKTIYYVDSTGAQNISGFAGGLDGKIIAVVNRDAVDTITLLHASGGSSAGNRIALPGDANVPIATRQAVMLMYNTTDNDWRIMSGVGL